MSIFRSKKFRLAAVLSGALFIVSFFVISIAYIMIAVSSAPAGSGRLSSVERFFLKDQPEESDPFITKNPGLKDMIDGPIITAADSQFGDEAAPAVIVEYADFTCDFCARQEEAIKKVAYEYKDHVRFVWKDYPGRDESSVSFLAAVAGRCAEKQGKFWNYHTLLFDAGSALDRKKIEDLSALAGIEKGAFLKCLESEEPKNEVRDNMKEADALGLVGVPLIYVNRIAFTGEVGLDEFRQAIGFELRKAGVKTE